MHTPVNYVEALKKHYGSMGFPPYQWTMNERAPLTPLTKPLAACTVALLTSGGISRRESLPWNPDARNDFRLDAIPSDTSENGFQVFDNYYDHTEADTDINTIFPIQRLRELAAEGYIGAVSARLWSGFMGRIYKRTALHEVEGPAFARKLLEDGVDVLVAVPA